MQVKKTKIRRRILAAFSAVLFCSFLLTGVIFNIAIRFLGGAETAGIVGRAGLILVVLTGVMFLVSVIVSFFLSNSITRPIEKLGKFALRIGQGDFTPNDFEFREEELQDLNMALNKSAKQLGVYDSEQKTFFQNVSHELRTPLTSIKCYAEGIAFGLMEPKGATETILAETDKLSDLVTDLLYISKIDAITRAFPMAETDIIGLIRDAALRQEAVAAKGQIRFVFDFDDEAISCVCVGEFLARAMDNLISNALRYAVSTVTLSCHRRAGHIEILVADDGAGMDAETLPHVFERFYKGPGGNHGIGLSIVKTIVERHGGSVGAENGSGGGAIFGISLPA